MGFMVKNIFKSFNKLEQANVDYIDYYNNKRIKESVRFSPCEIQN